MKPSIGRTVIVRGIESNGANEHPAVITRVWGPGDPAAGDDVRVNVTVFLDAHAPQNWGSVRLCESQEEAERIGGPVSAFWPPRA